MFSDAAGRRAAEALAVALGTEAQPESPRRFRPTAPAAGLDALGEATALALWLRPEEIALLVAAMLEGPGSGPLLPVLSAGATRVPWRCHPPGKRE
ncbi:MAG: hypothetical protein KAX51_13025 [Chromatiaceae bacterium]|nr:hypothetical protein [Chromatiaceae bacterium]